MNKTKKRKTKIIEQLCSLCSSVTLLVTMFLLAKYHDYWQVVVGGVIAFLICLIIIVIAITCLIRKKRIEQALETDSYDKMTGEEFEEFCADILRGNGYTNVEVTKASGDHGIDVLASKDGLRYAIQCKRYSKPVGNKAVQEAYSGKAIYKADVAVVMSNMDFTSQAIDDARKLGVELWDRNKIYSLQKRGNVVIEESIAPDNASEDLVCPKCGGNLVIRTAKRGANIGSKFYGCSNYPNCRYTKKL